MKTVILRNKSFLIFFLIWFAAIIVTGLITVSMGSIQPMIPLLFIFIITMVFVIIPFAIRDPWVAVFLLVLTFPLTKLNIQVGFFTPEPWIYTTLLLAFTLILKYSITGKTFRFTIFDIQIAIFFFVCILSFTQAIEVNRSLIRLFKYFFLYLMFFLIVNVIDTKEKYIKFLKILLLMGLIPIIGVLVELGFAFLTGRSTFQRLVYITSTFRNPSELAGYISLLLPIVYGLYFDGVQLFKKKILLVLVILLGATLILAQSRSSAIAVMIPFILYLNKKRLWGMIIAGIFAITIIFFTPSLNWIGARFFQELFPEKYSTRFVKNNKISTAGHYYINQLMLQLVKKNPILGVGLNNFQFHSNTYMNLQKFQQGSHSVSTRHTSPYGRPSHNFYLSIWVETGTLGLIALIILLTAIFINLLKIILSREDKSDSFPKKAFGKAILGGFISYLFYNFYHDLGIHEVRFWIILSLAAALIYVVNKKEKIKNA